MHQEEQILPASNRKWLNIHFLLRYDSQQIKCSIMKNFLSQLLLVIIILSVILIINQHLVMVLFMFPWKPCCNLTLPSSLNFWLRTHWASVGCPLKVHCSFRKRLVLIRAGLGHTSGCVGSYWTVWTSVPGILNSFWPFGDEFIPEPSTWF